MALEEEKCRCSEQEQELKFLMRAHRELNSQTSLACFCQVLVRTGCQLVHADAGTVGLVENDFMVFREYYRSNDIVPIDYRFEPDQGIPGWIRHHQTPYTTLDAARDPRVIPDKQQKLGIKNLINVPILDEHACLMGCLELHNKNQGPAFDSRDLDVLQELAASAAVALKNLQHHIEQQAIRAQLLQSQEHYRKLAESTSDWLWEVDHTGAYTYASPRLETLLGYRPEEIIGRTPFDLMPPEEAERIRHIFLNTIIKDQLPIERLVNINLHKEGHKVVLETSGVPIFDKKGRLTGYRGIDRDITTSFLDERNRELASLVLNNTPEGVVITDPTLRIISVNPAFTETTGYHFDEIKGCRPGILSSGKHDPAFYQDMWHRINETGKWQGEIWNRRKNGEIYPEWLNINAIKDDEGKVIYYAGIFSDISSQEHIRKRLHILAYYDDLTGLPNRELFHDRLDNAIAQANRHKNKLGLMFLDIDRFKNINDTLGHKTGDGLLKKIANKLLYCVRDSDSVCRIGGDEFTILVSDVTRPDDVIKIARKIIQAFSSPISLSNGMELYATTSIGICIYPNDGDCSETLLKNADTAMYRAKEAGRNNYQFYTDEMSRHFSERLSLENDLRKAIEENELLVAYQPQIDLLSGSIIGFEALARWKHARYGWVPARKFIPIAEDTGLIYRIGEQVLKQACQQIKIWREYFNPGLRMAINFSGHQLSKAGIVQHIVDIIDEFELPHATMELELTESSLMDNTEAVIRIMDQLSKTGIQFSIDDFGTGYSSLSYIKRFAIDKLKIDKSFVQDINIDNNCAEIVTTIIAMANNLGMEVIAEGVETREQVQFLLAHGCHKIQGHYFSQPQFADAITRMLREQKTFAVD